MKKLRKRGTLQRVPPKHDPLRPPIRVLEKLHTIALSAENLISPQKGKRVSRISLENALYDPDFALWILEMSLYKNQMRRDR